MEDPASIDASSLIGRQGPLTRDEATFLLDRGADLLARGEFPAAFQSYVRVYGFDDPAVTAAAMLGAGQARYRMDDEASAVAIWEKVLELPETPSTYYAWREVAAARVRDGDLQGAIAAYREADRRAPPQDKPEIANRLGWLAKETGNVRASRRYFARGRGAVMPIATYALMGLTIAISLTATISTEGDQIFSALQLDKVAVATGEYWRLFSVVFIHGGLLHLGFNMYALYLCGPLIEQIFGPVRMLAFYFVSALGASAATMAFGDARLVVGASGAIFGLFGILFAASRLHMPVLDRRGRALLGQVGFLIVTSLLFGFALPGVDNVAHIGGLVTGLLLGVAFPPGRVATLSSLWQPGTDRPTASRFIGSPAATIVSVIALVAGIAVCLAIGFGKWTP